MRKRIMDGLRKAGDKIIDMDADYANLLADKIMGDNPGAVRTVLGMSAGVPLGATGRMVSTSGELSNAQKLGAIGMNYGVPIGSAAVRYGVPLAGAGLLVNGISSAYNALSDVPVFPQDQTNAPVGY